VTTSNFYIFHLLAGDLQEFVDEFDDGKVQYGFARVIDPNNNLPKFVLVGWAGEGIPERVKGYFNGHFATISKYFHGYHVQITARSQDDLDVRLILSKVERASGAKYSAGLKSSTVRTRPTYSVSSSGANEDDWGDDAPPVVESEVTKVQSSYRPTKVDIAAIKSSAPKSSQFAATPAEPVKGSYQPVGKVDIAAIRSQAKDDRFNPKPSPLQSAYKPVGKVDIAAIKAQAAKKPSSYTSGSKPSAPASLQDDDEESAPKSLQDRMKAFGGNAAASGLDDEDEAPKSLKDRLNKYESNAERITSLPKPKVHNKVAGRFGAASNSSGTVPPLPGNSFGDSKKTVGGASRDFGSQGGKTPAQIWAEKHAKKTGTTSNVSSSPKSESVETSSVSSLRSSFASTAISQPSDEEPSSFNKQEVEEEEESTPHVSDLKSRFAQKFAASTPSRSPEPAPVKATPEHEEESAPSLPTRSLPPPLPTAERSLPPPLPSADRPVPAPEPAQTTSEFPPPPTRSLPPAFVPPTAAPQKEEEEEPAAAAPPALPSRSEPEPSTAEGSSDSAPVEAVVLFDYAKDDDNELGLTENEKITVLEFSHEEWWLGRDSKGNEGLFPAEYVEVLKKPYAIALYEYEATEDNELTFPEGAYITDITFDDEDWWSGVYMKKRDLFPKNYVELQE
jgi:hypothetical protein